MDVYREELFGPAGVVYKVADEDEAVAIANDTTFGLGSYVYTTDEEQAARVADKIEAGMVYVNVVLADSPELPSVGAAIIADYETSEGRSSIQEALRKRFAGAKPADAVQHSLANLREVSAILDAKAPADASSFKAWLSGISQKVAAASKEGGFLGIGGVQVSEAEKATLGDIAKALGTSA